MMNVRSAALLGGACALALLGAACGKKETAEPAKTQAAATGIDATVAAPDMQKVLDALAALGGKPIETLSPAEARLQPTPTDAVKAVMTQQALPTGPDATVTTQDLTYPADAGVQKARVYKPAGATGPLPVILYIHGGGWVIADIDVYDASPRALAKAANAIVVSIEYRHAPEAKFPAAHDDANAAYKWVLANAAKWGGDVNKVAVAGESAGGNMAVNVAISARDAKLPLPKSIIAVYPVADSNLATGSKVKSADTKPLNTKMLGWFFTHTLANPADAMDPRLNLVGAKLDGLPPTTIILASIDPLHDDGVNLAGKLKDAGVTVDLKEYPGVTHEFFGMGSVVAAAKEAQDYAAAKLKAGFGG